MTDLANLPFTRAALHGAYTEGLSPNAVIEEAYRRLAATMDKGIFISLVPIEDAKKRATALDAFAPERLPLWGLPFAIKDNIDLAGLPTTAGCPAYAYDPKADATVVARLIKAGAIPIGKTNLDQFATGLVGVRTPYSVPKNAIDPEIVPGGSSSGSAVATAHGIVTFALGTDTAGSGRVPAALNNIVGLKPSLGTLSATGVVPACRTLDTISIFALTVEDAYAAYRASAGFDALDAYSKATKPRPLGPFHQGLKVGIPDAKSLVTEGDEHQRQSFEAGCQLLSELGCDLVKLDFSAFYEVAAMLYQGAWVAERMTVIEDLLRSKPEAIHPVTRQIIEHANQLSAADAFRGGYKLAELRRLAEPALAQVDLLCVPTIPTFYSVAELAADPIGPNAKLGTYTNFVNLLDLCGIAVPIAARGDGRPGSLTLLASADQDHLTAALATAIHQRAAPNLGATIWVLPPYDQNKTEIGPNEMAIAVCGAHMSGLALNHQLTKLGGRFIEATHTAPNYKLYSLAGGPPKRPGMVQSPNGQAIDLEIWALPHAKVGAFITQIPYPLGIGRVMLDDGTQVQGFTCDPAGLSNAEDITHHKGWRAFLNSQA